MVGSPSKKRVIAIWTFHSDLWRRGIAAIGSWSVTDVYVCNVVCWLSLSWEISGAGDDMVASRGCEKSTDRMRWDQNYVV